jgi:hypothetical protein
MGSYSYIPSCQILVPAASQGPGVGNAYPLREALGCFLLGAWVSAPVQQERWDG